MRYLTTAEVLDLHRRIVERSGGAQGVRDAAALESSVGQPVYESFIAKAAALGYFLIRNHPFVEGNKCIGHAALEVTLALNGLELYASVDEQAATILRVADGSLSREEFTAWVDRKTNDLADRAMRRVMGENKHYPLVRARMTRARAEEVRRLRVEREETWRSVAAECHTQWGADADWDPPSNQIAGYELCEAAAEMFGEHVLKPPWN